ncbi:MAG: ABC transporter ATP-binding protein [Nitrososphaeria archaeon]
MTAVLEIIDVSKYFGGVHALDKLTITVQENTITAIIGPNGAGKTTLFGVITGVIKPDSGRVIFAGRDITRMPPHKISKLGIARTHQIPAPFLSMSVIENVMVAALYAGGFSMTKAQDFAQKKLEEVGLINKAYAPASTLTVYEMRLLEMASALASNPRLLLLDEPFAGLNPKESEEALNIIDNIKKKYGLTIIWVEHVIGLLRYLADHIIFLHQGRKLVEGKFDELLKNELVIRYLGRSRNVA